MCDIEPHGRLGWQGWPDLGTPRKMRAVGDWVDLAHELHDAIPMPHVFAQPSFVRSMAMPQDRLNVTRIEMVVHSGTHVDAPSHLFMDAPELHEVPFERLHGPGVVWKIDIEPFGLITAGMLEAMRPQIQAGDRVLIDTGWSRKWQTDAYWENPSLGEDAADWLVAQQVALVGVDFVSPDLALPRRGENFDWPVHKKLLSHGTLIAENVANLASLAGRRVEVIAPVLNIRGSDGSPARLMAREVELA